ncbi:peptidyl-prolyl cis-trans isomerase SurA [Streptosporangium becharense]|uniref:Peptidyl-prolyl cis-trans isomerase SurA n=1 Tax=Streptosporangium becharense TaxID=1816182 RepID=A0A7W9IJ33_9ACTN|nr:SurA N-terminal domain-containing protein [Streptosporangium becharense]MBB2913373.1 peptidyl-prolyl cis-trans isomerase SurA [Streptosporangium becharense]MBB5821063.1 peptidyl-prolyl cis-trans isomerase SurA [Streptosporangium becharense]
MKSTRVRVILAVAAAGVALTACSPNQAGSAAIVAGERITSSELDRNVQEYEAALAKANISASQLNFPGSVPQAVLFQLVTMKRTAKAAESKGMTATEGEVDQVIAAAGGQAAFEQRMVQQAIAPSRIREVVRSNLMFNKLIAKYGGGADDAAVQRGQVQAAQDLQAVKVVWNPRYGTFNEQRSEQQPQLFLDNDRFGKLPAAGAAAQPQ